MHINKRKSACGIFFRLDGESSVIEEPADAEQFWSTKKVLFQRVRDCGIDP